MVKIDHIAVYVKELENTRDFFIKYFDAKSNELYHNQHTGFKSYFLSFNNGCRLEIMSRPEIEVTNAFAYAVGFTHCAFSVGSKDSVDSITKILAQNGYETISGPRTTGDGYYESCIRGPEGIILEITE